MGAAFGYVGSITGVLLTFPFFTGSLPILSALFPIASSTFLERAFRLPRWAAFQRFVPTAALFLLFSLPLFLFCRDHNVVRGKRHVPWREAFRDVRQTLKEAREVSGNREVHPYFFSLSGCDGDDHREHGALRNLCDGIRPKAPK